MEGDPPKKRLISVWSGLSAANTPEELEKARDQARPLVHRVISGMTGGPSSKKDDVLLWLYKRVGDAPITPKDKDAASKQFPGVTRHSINRWLREGL